MNKRTASLLVLVVLVSLCTFGSESQRKSTSATANQRAAVAKGSAKKQSPTTPPTIGFLNPLRTKALGAIAGIFPASMGDFKGDGTLDAVTMVNISPGTPHYSLSAAINDGTGSFTTVLTATSEVQQNPIFVADLNGDGKDDVLLVHAADNTGTTRIQAWLSNGDGTFTSGSSFAVTTNGFVWAGIADVDGDGCPDVVVADSASPNGNIWTLLEKTSGTCDGNFRAATSVPFTGALNAFGPGNTSGVPGNPIVFADFNGDKKLDFAAAAATTNQIDVYLNNGAGYTATPLTTTDSVYDSYFLGYGNLGSLTVPQGDLVSANGKDGNVTIYVNNGSGVFATGVYYTGIARPAAISVADVYADGNPDLLVNDLNSGAIKVLTGNGDGTVNPATVGYITGGNPLMPALAGNFHGAGNPVDLLLPDNQTNFVYLQGYGDGSFRSGVNYYATNQQGKKNGFQAEGVGLASGDFNGDGIPDFVIGNNNGGVDTTGITVFLSNADGSLQTGVNYFPAGSKYSLQYVAVADFNGDGKLDIAASDNYKGVIQVFPGNGDGTFGAPVTYPAGGTSPHPVGIVTADFNGDGKPDLAFVNNFGPANAPTSANVGILINNGAGGFKTVVNSPVLNTVATELTAADVNGDGKLDLVVPLYGVCSAGSCSAPGSKVAILLGKGDGTLLPESDFSLVNGATTYFNPYDAAVGDLNGDGKADLAVTIQNVKGVNQGIAVALGNGDGTFQPPTLLATSPQNPLFVPPPVPGYVKIVDFNRDGHPDLVYTNAVAGTVGVLYGKGDGTFYAPLDFAANRWAWDFALADVNGDGVLDVVSSGFEQSFSGVGVLLNSSGSSTALQSSLPQSTQGQSVTFTATIMGSKVRGVTTVPTGTMAFFDGSTQMGQPVAISSGDAKFSTTALTVGVHSITAHYSGDITNYVPTTSAAVQQTVVQGAQPNYTLTSNPTSQTVNPGTAASFVITVAAVNGYNGTVSFPASACTGLPSGTSCSFSPSSITGSGTTTLTISTTAASAALMAPSNMNPHPEGSNLWASLGGIGMVGMILAGDWKKRNRRRLGIGFAILAVVMIMALVGCGGGSSTSGGGGGGGGGGTPAGSYAVKVSVTGTGNTTPHVLNLTLVVN